jgi:hypothetical protein
MSTELFVYEPYKRDDGWFSFRINGKETAFRSSSLAGIKARIALLMGGEKQGTVQLPPVEGAAKETIGGLILASASQLGLTPEQIAEVETKLGGTAKAGADWASAATEEERVNAFLARGKLGAA